MSREVKVDLVSIAGHIVIISLSLIFWHPIYSTMVIIANAAGIAVFLNLIRREVVSAKLKQERKL